MLYKRDDTMKRRLEQPRGKQAIAAPPAHSGFGSWIGLFLVVLLALTLRLVHVWQMRGTLFLAVLMGDSKGYDSWAQQIAAGDWMGQDVFYQAPLYPYVLATIFGVFGHDLLIARLVQAAIGAVSCGLLGYAAAQLFGHRVGLIAGVMLAVYPPAIFFDGLIQKSVLDVFLLCLALALCARLVTAGASMRQWIAVGVVMGALSLTRENALLLAAVIAWWAYRASGVRGVAVFATGVMLMVAPVALRNFVISGEWYLTTSQFGSNLYIGNNPASDGSYVALRQGRGSPEFERLDATELAEQAAGRRLTPAEVSRHWTTQTVTYIRGQPGSWLRLLVRKARLLVSRTEIIDTESQESHAEYSLALRALSPVWHFGVLLPIAVFGMIVAPDRRRLWPLYAMTAVYAMSVVLFFVVARYRLPLVPLLMLFAAVAVERVASLLADRKRLVNSPIRWALAVVAAVVVAVLAAWPAYSASDQQAITENNLGVALQEAGRSSEAIEHYRRAIALKPRYAPALTNLGTALRAAGRVDEAVAIYGQVLEQDGARATTHLNLGNALMTQGRTTDAIAAFREAVRLESTTHARESLANALYDEAATAIERGDHERAITQLREAIGLKPGYAEAHNNLGIALASLGKLEQAVMHWQEALRLKPDFADAQANLRRVEAVK
jgi:tetratricopeptide (TPR) repeat protein